VLTLALVTTALVAGAAGTWSPCGFSAIDTIGRSATHVLAACCAFGAGTVAGGVASFTVLAFAGSALDVHAAAGATAILAAAAAAAEAAGVRVVPQVRRQVPEPWRRVLPLPVTAALYGALLGVGFATFVLTLAFWALAAVVVVQGKLVLGVLVGAAFGLGRAVPVAVLATRPSGAALVAALAERPRLLRVWRLVCAAALAATALAAA
jgi:hypothetical protein